MASSPIFVLLPLLLVHPFLASLSFAGADIASTSLVSTGTICMSTPYPSICRSNLPSNDTGDIYYFGRSSVRKSLSQASKFLALVDKYLARQASLTIPAVRALEDCRSLASLNLDFLLSSFQAINATSSALSVLKADDVQTVLSAVLTNQITCLDGIQSTASAWSVKSGISVPLANDTKLSSVSLALFTRGWVPKKKKGNGGTGVRQPKSRQLPFQNGRMSFTMSSRTRGIYESVTRRALLQSSGDDSVLVSDMVVVSQDGTGNFTTINDAVAVAPNKTDGKSGSIGSAIFMARSTSSLATQPSSSQNCNLYPRLPMSGQSNMITAQGRIDVNQNTGTSIHNCIIKAANDLASSNTSVQTYLGRPWKQYSRTVYMQSFIDSLINPAGWQIWDGEFALSTLYYAEYNNTGLGSNTTNRVTWPGYHKINATDAANFTVSSFLLGDDWLPQTGVPYTSGLI
ncbi:hypothetical protein NL676_022391 [Syzygium grande]|nr:hypothetical protein NL676_022391 [Syzygium grande]